MCVLCRFVPDKEFSGTDRSAVRRESPVDFEKDEQEDPFGLNEFLGKAKEAKKRPAESSASSSKDHKKRRD